jgi:hypothetical protein
VQEQELPCGGHGADAVQPGHPRLGDGRRGGGRGRSGRRGGIHGNLQCRHQEFHPKPDSILMPAVPGCSVLHSKLYLADSLEIGLRLSVLVLNCRLYLVDSFLDIFGLRSIRPGGILLHSLRTVQIKRLGKLPCSCRWDLCSLSACNCVYLHACIPYSLLGLAYHTTFHCSSGVFSSVQSTRTRVQIL